MSENSRIHVEGLKPGDVALLRDIAESAAEKAVKKTFEVMGLDPEQPIKAQRDFALMRDLTNRLRDRETAADLQWVRRTRLRSEGMIGKILTTAIGVAVVGALHTFWTALQSAIGKH